MRKQCMSLGRARIYTQNKYASKYEMFAGSTSVRDTKFCKIEIHCFCNDVRIREARLFYPFCRKEKCNFFTDNYRKYK